MSTTVDLPAQRDARAVWLDAFVPDSREPDALRNARQRALDTFAKTGFPHEKDENWRGTNPAPFAASFAPSVTHFSRPVEEVVAKHTLAPECDEVVLVDGECFRAPSRSWENVTVESAPLDGIEDDGRPFAALNTAFFRDLIDVRIPPHAARSRPLHILHLSSGAANGACFPRTRISLEEASECRIVETFAGNSKNVSLADAVTHIHLEADASLAHVRLQRESDTTRHIGHLVIDQARGSHFTSHNVALGAAISRVEIDAILAGEGAECTLNGLFATLGTQHVDTRTRIDHAAPHCTSREDYRGLLDGTSRGVFHGRILVRPGAQKTDAKQTNRNLILSDDALVESTPQLEIRADDVRCTHGSTTGQLDEDALFYLRQRGLDERAARTLLILAFVRSVVDGIPVPAARRVVEQEMLARLPDPEMARDLY